MKKHFFFLIYGIFLALWLKNLNLQNNIELMFQFQDETTDRGEYVYGVGVGEVGSWGGEKGIFGITRGGGVAKSPRK